MLCCAVLCYAMLRFAMLCDNVMLSINKFNKEQRFEVFLSHCKLNAKYIISFEQNYF